MGYDERNSEFLVGGLNLKDVNSHALWPTLHFIKVVMAVDSPCFFSPSVVVPKPGDHWRPIIHLSMLNLSQVPHGNAPRSVKRNVSGLARRLPSCLNAQAHPTYLHLAIDNMVYSFMALPFRLFLLPWIFTHIIGVVVAVVQRSDSNHLDDYYRNTK